MINLFFQCIAICLKLFVTGLVVLFTPIDSKSDKENKAAK